MSQQMVGVGGENKQVMLCALDAYSSLVSSQLGAPCTPAGRYCPLCLLRMGLGCDLGCVATEARRPPPFLASGIWMVLSPGQHGRQNLSEEIL